MAKTPDSPDSRDPKGTQNANPAPDSGHKRQGKDFGFEGTNKTVPVPQPDAEPAPELQGTKSKFIPDSPYTRG